MKTKKRFFAILLSTCMVTSSLYMNALATNGGMEIPTVEVNIPDNIEVDKEIIKAGNYDEVIISDGTVTYLHNPEAADPTPHADNIGINRSSIVVTASDVWRETSTQSGKTVYRSNGYVTAAQYHYSRAELHFNFGKLAGQQVYGYGQVDSQTSYTYFTGGEAQIFYGS